MALLTRQRAEPPAVVFKTIQTAHGTISTAFAKAMRLAAATAINFHVNRLHIILAVVAIM